MNTLIVCDIDGCLNSGKMLSLDIESLSLLRETIKEYANMNTGFTLCTGRPQPYAEAFCRLLDINLPLICENGALIFDPLKDKTIHLAEKDVRQSTREVRSEIEKFQWFKGQAYFETGKEVCLSISGPYIFSKSNDELDDLTDSLANEIGDSSVDWTHSSTAIDITPKGINKGSALNYLVTLLNCNSANIVGIGDGAGDLPFLELSQTIMCPSNASEAVKSIADTVSEHPYAVGTLNLIQNLSIGDLD